MKKIVLLLVLVFPLYASAATFETNLSLGSRGGEVVRVQQFLIDKKYLTGTTTGYYGTLTKKAVTLFQKDNDLPTTGAWFPLTRKVAVASSTIETTQKNTITVSGFSVATTTPTTSNTNNAPLLKIANLDESLFPISLQQDAMSFLQNQIKSSPESQKTFYIAQKIRSYIEKVGRETALAQNILAVLTEMKLIEKNLTDTMQTISQNESLSILERSIQIKTVLTNYATKNIELYNKLQGLSEQI